MSTARWSLRLPRGGNRLTQRPLARTIGQQQRRWVQKPPPRARPWATRCQHEDMQEHQTKLRRLHAARQQQQQHAEQQPPPPAVGRNTQLATTLASSDSSDLVTEVHIPHDPDGVLPPDHPALSILGNSSLVIQRQIEMMNIVMGFEQANKYIIMNGQGQTIGYIAEQDHGIGSAMARQMFRTHRSFTTHIFDAQEREVLRIHRPFAYINSRIRIYDCVPEGGYQETETSTALQGTTVGGQGGASVALVSPLKLEEMRIIGETQQQWSPLRRKYNLFTYRPLTPASEDTRTPRIESGERPSSETTAITEAKAPEQAIEAGMAQFAHVNEPFLSWDFNLRSEDGKPVGSVNRNFGGFAREIFTDTGVYALRMDSAAQTSALEHADGREVERYEREATAMTLDQRAVMLATAVSIDFDYFSRHSSAGHGGGFFPVFWPMGGGAAEGGAAGAGAGAAGAGAAETGAAVGAGAGAMEGAGGAVAGAAGRSAAGVGGAGAMESGIAGAGTMAGYEAMQRGVYGRQDQAQGQDDASPTAGNPPPPPTGPGDASDEPIFDPDNQQDQGAQGGGESQQGNWWGGNDQDQDPWGGGGPPTAGGDAGGGGGGGWADTISDFFGGD